MGETERDKSNGLSKSTDYPNMKGARMKARSESFRTVRKICNIENLLPPLRTDPSSNLRERRSENISIPGSQKYADTGQWKIDKTFYDSPKTTRRKRDRRVSECSFVAVDGEVSDLTKRDSGSCYMAPDVSKSWTFGSGIAHVCKHCKRTSKRKEVLELLKKVDLLMKSHSHYIQSPEKSILTNRLQSAVCQTENLDVGTIPQMEDRGTNTLVSQETQTSGDPRTRASEEQEFRLNSGTVMGKGCIADDVSDYIAVVTRCASRSSAELVLSSWSLYVLAGSLTREDIYGLGIRLGISSLSLSRSFTEINTPKKAFHQILLTWMRSALSSPDTKLRNLINALKDCDLCLYADALQKAEEEERELKFGDID